MADCASLTGDTATVYGGDDVKLALGSGNAEGLVNEELECFKTEICVDILAVDCNNACTGNDSYTSNGFLSSTSAVKIGLLACIHILRPTFH